MLPHHPEHLYINYKEAEELVEEVGPHPLREFCGDGGIVILSVWVSCSHGDSPYSGTTRQNGFAFAL